MKLAAALANRNIRHPAVSQKAVQSPEVESATVTAKKVAWDLSVGSRGSLKEATKFYVE